MPQEPAYLDNAATTRVAPAAVGEMSRCHAAAYGNPSSSHGMGIEAARVVDRARAAILRRLAGEGWELVFTSSGTEANNLALAGWAAPARKGLRAVTTAIEHASVLEPLRALEEKGVEVARVPCGPAGAVDPEAVAAAAAAGAFLVSVQHANNEIGALQPVEEIGARCKALLPGVLFHVDAVQTAGKVPLAGMLRVADLVTVSAHKLHGPKGVGALLVKGGTRRPAPLLRGGGQEQGLRSGTENVPGIAGFAVAVEEAAAALDGHAAAMGELEAAFDECFAPPGEARRLFAASPRVPGFVVVGFPAVPSEVVEHAMEREGYVVSSTAACSSRKVKRSHVLDAAGVPADINVIRIVPSRFTTAAEMRGAARALTAVLHRLL